MSTENDTAPAAETEIAEIPATALSDILTTGDEGEIVDPAAAPAAAEPAPPAPAAAAPAATPAPPPAPAGEPDPATDPKAPKWYRDHMAKTNRELAALRAEKEQQRFQPPPAPRPAATAATLPNPAEDPQAYHEAIQANYRQEMQEFQLVQTLRLSERFAVQQHGGEAFEECRAWLTTKPDIEAWAIQQPDPWSAAFMQYNRERIADEIGDDPAAYREKIRQELLAEQAGQTPAPAPAPTMRRDAPPAPASTARNAGQAERDASGRFATPLSAALRR